MTEETLEPVKYFCKMPKDVADRDILIVAPEADQTNERGCSHQQKGGIFKNYFLRCFNRDDLNYRLFLLDYLLHHGHLSPRLPDPGRVR